MFLFAFGLSEERKRKYVRLKILVFRNIVNVSVKLVYIYTVLFHLDANISMNLIYFVRIIGT